MSLKYRQPRQRERQRDAELQRRHLDGVREVDGVTYLFVAGSVDGG